MNNIKKIVFIILVCMLCDSVEAKSQNPKYKIISIVINKKILMKCMK